jgi:hypothetical protein
MPGLRRNPDVVRDYEERISSPARPDERKRSSTSANATAAARTYVAASGDASDAAKQQGVWSRE